MAARTIPVRAAMFCNQYSVYAAAQLMGERAVFAIPLPAIIRSAIQICTCIPRWTLHLGENIFLIV